MTYQQIRHPFFRLLLYFTLGLACAPSGISQSTPQQAALDEAFLTAVQNRDLAKMQELLNRGANINARSSVNRYYALQYAVDWPDVNLVKLLLDKGADINLTDDGGNTALMVAASDYGPLYKAIVKLLLDRGADVQAGGNRALFNAAEEAGPEIVQLLLKKGANPKARDAEGNTVLMSAAHGDFLKAMRVLLDAGADPKAVNESGQTVLMKAASVRVGGEVKNHLAMLKLLLDRGVDVNAKDKEGKTALLHAVHEWRSEAGGLLSLPEILRLLLARGADVNARDNKGNTALMIAVQAGNIRGVKILLEKGATANLQNRDGWTAMKYAKTLHERIVLPAEVQSGIVALLEKAGANE